MQSELIQSVKTNVRFNLDPRTKLLLMLIVNITVFRASSLYVMVALSAIPIALLVLSGKPKAAAVSAVAYIASAMANEYIVPITHGALNIVIVMVAGMLYRLAPVLIMGYYLVTTTTVSEFIGAMERMHVSSKIVIPLSVMFRFFPTVHEEARSISDAMRMRGIRGVNTFKNPVAALEYRLVPMLMCSVKIGDELSAASLTRGLGSPVKRTNICKIGFKFADVAMITLAVAAFIAFLFI